MSLIVTDGTTAVAERHHGNLLFQLTSESWASSDKFKANGSHDPDSLKKVCCIDEILYVPQSHVYRLDRKLPT